MKLPINHGRYELLEEHTVDTGMFVRIYTTSYSVGWDAPGRIHKYLTNAFPPYLSRDL